MNNSLSDTDDSALHHARVQDVDDLAFAPVSPATHALLVREMTHSTPEGIIARQAFVRELAEDEVAHARKSLSASSPNALCMPPSELEAVHEALQERRRHARQVLLNRLRDVSQDELDFLDALVGEHLNRFYLEGFVPWRQRDGTILASTVSKTGMYVQRNAPAA